MGAVNRKKDKDKDPEASNKKKERQAAERLFGPGR
jgi:hypothetical protein